MTARMKQRDLSRRENDGVGSGMCWAQGREAHEPGQGCRMGAESHAHGRSGVLGRT